MLQSVSSVFVAYRCKTLTGSPDPTHANSTDKPCTLAAVAVCWGGSVPGGWCLPGGVVSVRGCLPGGMGCLHDGVSAQGGLSRGMSA